MSPSLACRVCPQYGPSHQSNPSLVRHLNQNGDLKSKRFMIPLSKHPNLNRVALGIRDSVTEIHILILQGHCNRCPEPLKTLFCIHFHPIIDHAVSNGDRERCLSPEQSKTCRGNCPNILNIKMQSRLDEILDEYGPKFAEIPLEKMDDVLSTMVDSISTSCSTNCIVGGQDPNCQGHLKCEISRAMPCANNGCRETFRDWRNWPLAVRFSPLLRDPSVLDLLLTMLKAELDVIPDASDRFQGRYPLTVKLMKRTIDSFPRLDPGIPWLHLIGPDPAGGNRRTILHWLCDKFEGMLVPTPPSAKVHGMPGSGESFLLLSTRPRWQAAFEKRLVSRKREKGGTAAFHGAPPHALFNIMCDGLKVGPSRHIYYTRQPAHTIWYIAWRSQFRLDTDQGSRKLNYPNVLRGWKNSKFKNMVLMFGVEVAGPRPENHEAGSLQKEVMVRYLFLLPADKVQGLEHVGEWYWENELAKNWLDGNLVLDRMEAAYQDIHHGSLMARAS